MIVILEGLNGTGKTTVAKTLATDHGFRIYRPLREDYDAHWRNKTGSLELSLRACRVQPNTYLDDVFGADAIAQLRPDKVVLDRAMPSALAYGLTKGEIKGDPHREALETYWHRRLLGIGVPVFYFWLTADHVIARKRSDDGHYPDNHHLAAMEASFTKSFEAARKAGFKAVKINTNKKPAMEQIAREIGETT
jgi:thymidylate kinase